MIRWGRLQRLSGDRRLRFGVGSLQNRAVRRLQARAAGVVRPLVRGRLLDVFAPHDRQRFFLHRVPAAPAVGDLRLRSRRVPVSSGRRSPASISPGPSTRPHCRNLVMNSWRLTVVDSLSRVHGSPSGGPCRRPSASVRTWSSSPVGPAGRRPEIPTGTFLKAAPVRHAQVGIVGDLRLHDPFVDGLVSANAAVIGCTFLRAGSSGRLDANPPSCRGDQYASSLSWRSGALGHSA